MTVQQNPTTLIEHIKAIAQAQARYRPALFQAFHADFQVFLESDGGPVLDRPPEWDDFKRRAAIYLRALSTYSPASDEWMDVFRAFRSMAEQVLLPARVDTPRESVMDSLRRNPRITLTER